MKKWWLALLILVVLGTVGYVWFTPSQPGKVLISTHITLYAVEGTAETLQFPTIEAGKQPDELLRNIDEAEYYYQKLSKLYHLRSFYVTKSIAIDTILSVEGNQPLISIPLAKTKRDSSQLSITAVRKNAAQFEFVANGKRAVRKEFAIESGSSTSLGILNDSNLSKGTFIAISYRMLPITKTLTPETVRQFLLEKNRPFVNDVNRATHTTDSVKRSKKYLHSDQSLLDQLFGKGAQVIESNEYLENFSQQEPTDIPFIEVEQPPLPVGGMGVIGRNVKYPPNAIRDTVQGTVFLSVAVDSSGKVIFTKVLRGVRPDLDSAALRALTNVLFTPGIANGKPVRTWVTLPISFRLR